MYKMVLYDVFNFNPRSREGSDTKPFEYFLGHSRFQSTLPRRERRKLLETTRIVVNFNPRSREGSDGKHAYIPIRHTDFNPRSREGSDSGRQVKAWKLWYFNPRSREGSDDLIRAIVTRFALFQSTLPRRERHHFYCA